MYLTLFDKGRLLTVYKFFKIQMRFVVSSEKSDFKSILKCLKLNDPPLLVRLIDKRKQIREIGKSS